MESRLCLYLLRFRLSIGLALNNERFVALLVLLRHLEKQLICGRLFGDPWRGIVYREREERSRERESDKVWQEKSQCKSSGMRGTSRERCTNLAHKSQHDPLSLPSSVSLFLPVPKQSLEGHFGPLYK